MRSCIPGELWNQVCVPSKDTTSTLVSTYLSEMAYKLSSITDVMMVKEFWHTVCDIADRCGALRERVTGTVQAGSMSLTIQNITYGNFQRFVGAGVNNIPVGLENVTTADSSDGPIITFNNTLAPESGTYACYADISVVPDVNATPINQKVPLWFLKAYDKALLSGAFMRIYAMEGEKWTDSTNARMNATTYLSEINRLTRGLITSGMRKNILIDAESILARSSTTTTSNSTTNTVG